MRERVWLAHRIALARWLGLKWAQIAALEGMSERTLRYHFAQWKEGLERERVPTSALLAACELTSEKLARETTMEIEETARIAAEGTPGHRARQSTSSTCLLGEVVTFIGGSGWVPGG